MSHAAKTNPRAEAVYSYWLGELKEGTVDKSKYGIWYKGGEAVDKHIKQEFEGDFRKALAGEYDDWMDENRTTVSLIVLLDQFTRNMYRGTPDAFSGDAKALGISKKLIESGRIQQLAAAEAFFALHPLEHSEELQDQHLCVEQFKATIDRLTSEASASASDTGPTTGVGLMTQGLTYAEKHRDVIVKFGRFPHRNAILGRESSPEEIKYLEEGGGF